MNKNKECRRCKFYRAFYTKELCCFKRQEKGYCKKNDEIIVDNSGTCPNWYYNGTRRRIQTEISLKALNNALDKIIEIKQILVDITNDDEG